MKSRTRSQILLIFKSGHKSNPSNYRPVSLICVCCKVMGHVVLCHLNRFLAVNNILTDLQHGFRRGFSCETQLILTVHDWASILNKKGQVDAILLDFSKAFDTVSHPKLLLNWTRMAKKVKLWTGSKLFSLTAFSLFQWMALILIPYQ